MSETQTAGPWVYCYRARFLAPVDGKNREHELAGVLAATGPIISESDFEQACAYVREQIKAKQAVVSLTPLFWPGMMPAAPAEAPKSFLSPGNVL